MAVKVWGELEEILNDTTMRKLEEELSEGTEMGLEEVRKVVAYFLFMNVFITCNDVWYSITQWMQV